MSVLSINLPNFITLGRVISVPIVFWLLLNGNAKAAFLLFVLAGVSDAVDGYLAKRYQLQTQLGAYLDPLADKLLLVSTFIALGVRDHLPSWMVILVVSRDVMIVSAILLAVVIGRPLKMHPLAISKLNTVAQIGLALLVLADAGFALHWQTLRDWMIYTTALLTVGSAAAYFWSWLGQMAGTDGAQTP